MHTSVLIIGQGLSGTWLSYWLSKASIDCVVIDDHKPNASSQVASGIINPVTGRRMVKTWMADELLPFAENAYQQMGIIVEQPLIKKCSILDFFSAPDRRLNFEKRAENFEPYLSWPEDQHAWLHYFDYPFGYGIVTPAYQVNVQNMLAGWRQILAANNQLLDIKYEPHKLQVTDHKISYEHITADRIIFCDGTAAMQHHFFDLLPFAINKGEALIVAIPGLSQDFVYKKTYTITPWKDGLFWVGSTYDRAYTNDEPTMAFRQATEGWLQQFVKVPFTVVDHLAALRPTTVERRPFAGMHPHYNNVGILNGMGTKGVSLAPFLSRQLADYIAGGNPLQPEADVKYYSRVLSRL